MGALRNPAGAAARPRARALRVPPQRTRDRALARDPRRGDRRRRGPGADGAGAERLRPRALLARARPRRPSARRLGLGDGFVCSYFGTLGEANDLSQVVRAAPLARGRDLRAARRRQAARRAWSARRARSGRPTWSSSTRCPTRRPWPGWPRRRTPASRSSRTCPCSPPTRRTSCSTPSPPGGPAIVNQPGWMRELVEGNEAGLFVRARATPRTWPRRSPGCATTRTRSSATAATPALLAEREFDRDALAGARAGGARGGRGVTELSYCVVNTNGREHLLACLDAIAAHPSPRRGARGAGARQRLRRRLGRGRARAASRGAPDRARAPRGQGGQRLAPAARGRRPLLPAAERGLGAGGRVRAGAAWMRSRPIPAPRWPGPSC